MLDRENVAVVCKLELKADPSVKFLVATTHLLYNPKRQDIRLAQVQILLAELDRISKVPIGNDEKAHLPIILSGDFNLQPHSAPYNLIVNGETKLKVPLTFHHQFFPSFHPSGFVNYEKLSRRTLTSEGKPNNPSNGRSLLPIKLGITDECQHVNHEIKVNISECNKKYRKQFFYFVSLVSYIIRRTTRQSSIVTLSSLRRSSISSRPACCVITLTSFRPIKIPRTLSRPFKIAGFSSTTCFTRAAQRLKRNRQRNLNS